MQGRQELTVIVVADLDPQPLKLGGLNVRSPTDRSRVPLAVEAAGGVHVFDQGQIRGTASITLPLSLLGGRRCPRLVECAREFPRPVTQLARIAVAPVITAIQSVLSPMALILASTVLDINASYRDWS
ncbi:hypothetical protein ACIOHH_37065 [Streptomyces microflavus]|uniref:hypothetical protein n=1 Tax=Streptomyces microflavus TaxID=1919 RepID=UPI0038021D86